MKLIDWLFSSRTSGGTSAQCRELFAAAREYQIRAAALNVCVNMIANAIGRCELRTFERGRELRGREYYAWNIEPNANQSSSDFWHAVLHSVCKNNEALIVPQRKRDGTDAFYVADAWNADDAVLTAKRYSGIRVGDLTLNKTFRENDVIHIRLNHIDVSAVMDGLYTAYVDLLNAAMSAYKWDNGQHLKVHVEQLAQGGDNWAKDFQSMIDEQIKPFINSSSAVLPEFDGYKYERMERSGTKDSGDILALTEDVFNFTARAFMIPAVLINGKVEGTKDAYKRFLTDMIDPICDQISEEITRKRYGYEDFAAGTYARMDSSAITHFDIFGEAAGIEKLIGSAAFTPNDVLRAAGLPPIPEGWADKHYMTKNIATVEEMLSAADGKGEADK